MQEVTYLLFTTTTCSKCPAIKAWIDEHLASYTGEVLDNTRPDFMEKAQAHGITAAPTFLLFAKGGEEMLRTQEISALADYFS